MVRRSGREATQASMLQISRRISSISAVLRNLFVSVVKPTYFEYCKLQDATYNLEHY